MRGRRYKRVFFLIALLGSVSATIGAELPRWASSFGINTPFEPPEYVSGFGVAGREASDQREAARQQALAALAEKIQVRVRSEIVAETQDTGRDLRSSLTNVVNTSSDVRVQGVRYEYAEERGSTYVLAYARIDTLQRQYIDDAAQIIAEFESRLDGLESEISRGNVSGARQLIGDLRADLETLAGHETIWRALGRLREAYAASNESWPYNQASELLGQIRVRENRLSAFRPRSEIEAARYLAGQIVDQATRINAVTPLIFQDSDFSSAFGLRFARTLESEIAAQQRPASSASDAIVRGRYWVDEQTVGITVTVRGVTAGRALTGASVEIPIPAISDAGSLRPANSAEAMESGAILLSDAVADGGLRIEVWTDRGSMQDVPVYEDDDTVQFFFRVNQPAFLRLSYQLATGEVVLLESQFYIDVSRVNRPVPLPYQFRVVPPFGVERLIVTGYSTEPPPADTRIETIDGQQYEVFASAGAVVARTRGLVRERVQQPSGNAERLGEATMTLTTAARESNLP